MSSYFYCESVGVLKSGKYKEVVLYSFLKSSKTLEGNDQTGMEVVDSSPSIVHKFVLF